MFIKGELVRSLGHTLDHSPLLQDVQFSTRVDGGEEILAVTENTVAPTTTS